MAHPSAYNGVATRYIHAGQPADPVSGAVMTPISLSTTFLQKSPGNHTGYEYSRSGNPTRNAFEECVAAAEGAKHGFAFGSGLAASTTFIHLFKHGDHVIVMDDVYGGTNRLFNRVVHPTSAINFNNALLIVIVTMVDVTDPAKLLAAVKPETKLIWLESPTNPTLKMVDIHAVCTFAKSKGILVLVDNTFMSPYFQNPLALGADVVLHSVTKYLNGHSDVVMGVLACNDEELAKRLRYLQNALGAVPSPFDCYLAMRGMKTLHVRMREHEKNAIAVAEMLSAHPKVLRVVYPGLKSHPQHELAKMRGFGGMITFFLKGGLNESRCFLEHLKLFALAESLGGVESLAEHPAIMTHASVPVEQRAALGIDDSLCRLSVGIEDLNDILADLHQALDAVKSPQTAS